MEWNGNTDRDGNDRKKRPCQPPGTMAKALLASLEACKINKSTNNFPADSSTTPQTSKPKGGEIPLPGCSYEHEASRGLDTAMSGDELSDDSFDEDDYKADIENEQPDIEATGLHQRANYRPGASFMQSAGIAPTMRPSRPRGAPGLINRGRGEAAPGRFVCYRPHGHGDYLRSENPRGSVMDHGWRGESVRGYIPRGRGRGTARGRDFRGRAPSPGHRGGSPRHRGGSPRDRGGSPRHRGGSPRGHVEYREPLEIVTAEQRMNAVFSDFGMLYITAPVLRPRYPN